MALTPPMPPTPIPKLRPQSQHQPLLHSPQQPMSLPSHPLPQQHRDDPTTNTPMPPRLQYHTPTPYPPPPALALMTQQGPTPWHRIPQHLPHQIPLQCTPPSHPTPSPPHSQVSQTLQLAQACRYGPCELVCVEPSASTSTHSAVAHRQPQHPQPCTQPSLHIHTPSTPPHIHAATTGEGARSLPHTQPSQTLCTPSLPLPLPQ